MKNYHLKVHFKQFKTASFSSAMFLGLGVDEIDHRHDEPVQQGGGE